MGVNIITYSIPGSYNYIPTAGTLNVIVEVLGAGGASGGCFSNTLASVQSVGGAGAGGYSKSVYPISFIRDIHSIIVTVGSAGLPNSVVSYPGGNGGSSSFGTLMICGGGNGSQLGSSETIPIPPGTDGTNSNFIGLGGIASGGNIVNVNGQPGGTPISLGPVNPPASVTPATAFAVSGAGGNTLYGGGGFAVATSTISGLAAINGNPASGFGSGGGGGSSYTGGPHALGAAGANGLIIIMEYNAS